MPSHAGEFELIKQHLSALGAPRADVELGVGDDAAVVDVAPHDEIRCTCACVMLVDRSQQRLTQAIDAVFKDLVAALKNDAFSPAWATLVLTLSQADETFIHAIATAVHTACCAEGIAVIGGDTTAGSDSLTIFLSGLRNSGAR